MFEIAKTLKTTAHKMSLICSGEESMFGGEAESDGPSVTEATGAWGMYTNITAFQQKVTAEPQEESMKLGSGKAMFGVSRYI